ncbi:MAG TPA: hypothetical protein VJC17_00475 [Candidatus Dojkabacteria bacterium]|nr:hypothetical protein [Candidatus Dojkabacteria bacterium]
MLQPGPVEAYEANIIRPSEDILVLPEYVSPASQFLFLTGTALTSREISTLLNGNGEPTGFNNPLVILSGAALILGVVILIYAISRRRGELFTDTDDPKTHPK